MKEKRVNDQEKKVRNQVLNQDKNQVSGSYFFSFKNYHLSV